MENHAIDHLRYEFPSGELFPSSSHSGTIVVVNSVAAAENSQLSFIARNFSMPIDVLSFRSHYHRIIVNSDTMQNFICAVLMAAFVCSDEFRNWYDTNKNHLIMNDYLRVILNKHNENNRSINSILRSSMIAMISAVTTMSIPSSKRTVDLEFHMSQAQKQVEDSEREINGYSINMDDGTQFSTKSNTERILFTEDIGEQDFGSKLPFPAVGGAHRNASSRAHD
jgi:hypothetical protein